MLQYYNQKETWGNNSKRQATKARFVEEFNQRNDKKHPFHREKWAKKHLPKHGVSLIELLRSMVFLGRVHCTQLDFS
jgi:hypothetical protein